MNLKTYTLAAASLAAFALPTSVSAATLVFDFDGDDDRSFNFTLDDTRAPDGGVSFGSATRVEFDNVAGTFVGANGTDAFANVSFGTGFLSTLQIGGINFSGTFGGPDLFNGSRNNPQFNLGSFALTAGALNPAGGTLTISQATGAIPEPATWAMMLLGFFGMGLAMRRSSPASMKVSYS